MELKNLQQQWESFPEISMEERPILSSDLEKIVVKNPLSDAFYLRKRLMARIVLFSVLWIWSIVKLRGEWKSDGSELYQAVALFGLLGYTLYFHIRLLLYADYPTLLALPLMSFLGKLETVLDKYIISYKFISGLAAFYALTGIEWLLGRWSAGAHESLIHNEWYKWLILIFIWVSIDILLLHTLIPRHRNLLVTVRKYKEGIQVRSQNK